MQQNLHKFSKIIIFSRTKQFQFFPKVIIHWRKPETCWAKFCLTCVAWLLFE